LIVGVGHKPLCREFPDISENRDSWPMLGEDAAAVGIDFTERDGSHSGSLKPETEPSDAAE
jgi:hypothetical protein